MHGTSTLTAFIGFNFGQRVVVHRRFVPEEVLRTIEKEKVTSVSLVGDAMLRPLIDALKGPLKGVDCSSMFSVSSSGAIMSDSVRAEFQALVPTVMLLNNFGSSESGFNGTATADSGPEKGFRVQVNSRTAVVDPATYEPVAPGEPGRIAQRGHVPLGYYNDPAKTAETFFRKGRNGGYCSVTWRPSTTTASSPSSGAVRSASTPVARRSIRRRSSRRSRPIRTCTTRWSPESRTPGGAIASRRFCNCATERVRWTWKPYRRTAAPGWPDTRFRAVSCSPTASGGHRAARRTTGGPRRSRLRPRRAGRGTPFHTVPKDLSAATNSSGPASCTRCPTSMVTKVLPGIRSAIQASCSWST